MRRLQVVQQGELLVEREPGPALTARTRTMVLPLVATLLLEAAAPTVTRPGEVREMEGSDEQDHP